MLEHPNKTKAFSVGYLHNARPTAKSFRFESTPDVVALAKEMRRLTIIFELTPQDLYNIVHQEYGEGIGKHTIVLFMDDVYGPAFRPRKKTLEKYKYLVWFLREMEKQFANPKK